MSTFVLVILMNGFGVDAKMYTQEFSSRASCTAAQIWVETKSRQVERNWLYATCLPK